MKHLKQIFITICVIVFSTNFLNVVNGTESITLEPNEEFLTTTINIPQDIKLNNNSNNQHVQQAQQAQEVEVKAEQRSIDFHGSLDAPTPNEDRHAAFRKRAKPLKSIFMGIYKNYKSTYMGNKTLAEYRNAMRLRKIEEQEKEAHKMETKTIETTDSYPADVEEYKDMEIVTEKEIELSPKITNEIQKPMSHTEVEDPIQKTHNSKNLKKKRKKQRLRNHNHRRNNKHDKVETKEAPSQKILNPVYRYDFGNGYNMSLDMSNEIVSLNLDGDILKDLMQGRLLKDTSEGRGKKTEMITRVLPLFIIPFLIQSAVVPFLVTKLKLLLMKSILVGKLAIFLLVLSAIRNSNKPMQTYEVGPSFWAGEPSRRSELAAAASAAAYNGYRVEGKPAAWIN